MAKDLSRLDAEARALHESWDDVGRVVLIVALVAAVIWALCTALKKGVLLGSHALLAAVAASPTIGASAALLCSLLLAGVFRGVLHRRPSWTEVERDGIDVALHHYHLTYQDQVDSPAPRYGLQAFRLALRKALATLVTLGLGGSGGLEGPVVLIGESVGAGCARVMGARSEHELRTYQLAGIAAAVATLLNAPFTAALFAIEVVYGDRIIYRKLAYALLAGCLAYLLNERVLGHPDPFFVAPPHARTYAFEEYAVSALVAVAISAPVALAFGLAMKHTRSVVDRGNPLVRSLLGAVGTGAVALGLAAGLGVDVRHTLGMGDWTLRQLLAGEFGGSVWILGVILVGRMLTTAFTIQSGGSAGLLIPSMFLGGVAGAATGSALQLVGIWPALDVQLFVVVGIASALVAMVGVPLAAIALVLEVFGPQYGPPTILACGLTYVVTLRLSVYEQRSSPDPVADETGARA